MISFGKRRFEIFKYSHKMAIFRNIKPNEMRKLNRKVDTVNTETTKEVMKINTQLYLMINYCKRFYQIIKTQ